MTTFDRRAFVQTVGAAGIASVLSPSRIMAVTSHRDSEHSASTATTSALFAFSPGFAARLDPETGVTVNTGLWALANEEGNDLRPLLQPVSQEDADRIAEWFESAGGDPALIVPSGSSLAATLLRTRFVGNPYVGDLVAKLAAAIARNTEIVIPMQFSFSSDSAERTKVVADGLSALPTLSANQGVAQHGLTVAPAWIVPLPSPKGMKYQIRYTPGDVANFGSCAGGRRLQHCHFESFRLNVRGGWDYYENYHIAMYRQGSQLCLVITEDERVKRGQRPFCWNKCTPTYGDLERMLEAIVITTVAALGLSIAGWMVGAIANTAAAALWPVLLL